MAVTYVVCLHRGLGVIGGSFTTLALAQAFVGDKPYCAYEIQAVTTDAAVGTVVPQAGIGLFTSQGPGLSNVGGP